ncbi:MAG: aminomethyl-transferring glycine dehydrogenase subunit GcvPA [Candidatus Omnitrophica bacterium]|nr:aminomethyl-transferring glycine dehydrogenase subunit GcvPA [Candidatus Omnitrophota bacterium]
MDYVPNTDAQLKEMLRTIGVGSFEELIAVVPPALHQRSVEVPPGLVESEVLALTGELAARNRSLEAVSSFLGAGAYHHVIPTVVDALAARGEWLTPYTPYQAEASQGTLQAIYEFQTMVCELLQMDVANASLYDGASSAAEAVVLALRATERPRVLISEAVHPHARQVIATYVSGMPAVLQEIPTVNGVTDLEALGKAARDDVACVLLQQPNVFGVLEPMAQAGELAHRVGALFAASVYPVSLGLLQPPGAYGADIAVAEGRCLGSPPAYGGPGLGVFTTTQALLRRIPGRLAGCTVDQSGARGFTLTLQTREQHIRRERATSNICTNEGWLALRATIFLSLMGPHGMQELAQLNLEKAHYAYERLREIPWIHPAFDQPFFNEFTVQYEPPMTAEAVNKRLARAGIIGGLPLTDWFPGMPQASLWCVTELASREAIDRTVEVLKSFTPV